MRQPGKVPRFGLDNNGVPVDWRLMKKKEVCGAYGGTVKYLGRQAEVICQRSPGHKRPHIAAPFGWPQIWTRPVPRNLPEPPKLKTRQEYADFVMAQAWGKEREYKKDKYGHFDDPQKSCYDNGCTDDCTASKPEVTKPAPEPKLSWWKRVDRWFSRAFGKYTDD